MVSGVNTLKKSRSEKHSSENCLSEKYRSDIANDGEFVWRALGEARANQPAVARHGPGAPHEVWGARSLGRSAFKMSAS